MRKNDAEESVGLAFIRQHRVVGAIVDDEPNDNTPHLDLLSQRDQPSRALRRVEMS